MASDNKQLKITISPTNLKLLEKWAGFHGRAPGEFAGYIIARQIEADREMILSLVDIQNQLAYEPDHDIEGVE